MIKIIFNIIMVSFMFSFCFEFVLKVLRFNNNFIIVIVFVLKFYLLFILMGDESYGVDDVDKLFICIVGLGNFLYVLFLIYVGLCSCFCFGIVFCFILKCFILVIVCLI